MGISNYNNIYSNDGIMGNYDLDIENYNSIYKSENNIYYEQDSIYINEENNKLVSNNKYNNDLSIYGGSLISDSKVYRKTELKFRFYRICENMYIKNPDRIYDMFIKRYINRKRLEYSSNKLEIVIAALFYIDQRINTTNNYTIKDILNRIKDNKINLKQFTKIISKILKELKIENLPNIDDNSIIGNLMEEIRTYLIENINKNDKNTIIPKSTTCVIATIDEIFNINGYNGIDDNNGVNDDKHGKICLNENSLTVKTSTKSTPKTSPKRIINDNNRYKLIYKSLGCNYEKIEKFCLRILKLVDDPSLSENILDPKNRVVFRCRKTLISCSLLLVILSVKIPFNSNMLIKALKLSRSSFYRNLNKLVSKLILMLSKQYKCKINNINDLLALILVPIEKIEIEDNKEDRNMENNKDNTYNKDNGKIKENKKKLDNITNQILKVGSILNGNNTEKYNKNTKFNMVVNCLDLLKETELDNNKDNNDNNIENKQEMIEINKKIEESKKNSKSQDKDNKDNSKEKKVDNENNNNNRIQNLYYDTNRSKYICRYNLKGQYRRKTFSVNYYGKETAYNMARCFLKNVAN